MIVAFDELILRCSDENSRVHIREAVQCYESGAYRAAIVTAYVALCFDLIEKLRILAASGDGTADQELTKLQDLQTQRDNGNLQAIAGLLEFERSLLELFRDRFEFFGTNEFEELRRLREDRNRCAHPTFFKSTLPYSPSAELARTHIRNALILVLTEEPRQGKAALGELQAVVISKYFPEDTDQAVERLRAAGLSNARDTLLRGFVDALIFGVPDQASPYYNKFSAVKTALRAAIEIKRAISLPRAVVSTNKLLRRPEDEAIRSGAMIALQVQEVGAELDDVAKGVTRQWLAKETSKHLANILRFAMKLDWLRGDAMARVGDLEAANYKNINASAPPEIVSHAASLYANIQSWDEATRVGDLCAIPLVSRFSEADLRMILGNTAEGKNDLRSSGHFKRFTRVLRRRSQLGADFVDALLNEYGLPIPEEDEGSDD